MKYLYLSAMVLAMLSSCKDENMKNDDSSNNENDSIAMIEKAKAIHDRVITLDTHCDINVKNFTDSLNYKQDLDTQVTLPKMEEGGLDVAWFIVYTGQDTLTEEGYAKAYENAISKFEAIHYLTDSLAPKQIELATTSEEVRRIIKSGKKVAMIGIENGYPIGNDIGNVEKFHRMGARYMSLAHNGHSQLSDSNTGEEDDVWLHGGLSDLGKEVVKEMNRVGMMVDVSHPSKEAMRQMIEISKAPIIASHSSARALCNHSRNLDDEQLQWMKDNGGVVQTVAFEAYVNTEKNDARSKAIEELEKNIMDSLGSEWMPRREIRNLPEGERDAYIEVWKEMRTIVNEKSKTMKDLPPGVNVSDFVDHIDYMVEKIGIEHVGISSDFDGGGGIEGWNDASETFNVTLELVKRGYTEDEIAMLWSGNLLRVLDEVEEIGKNIQKEQLAKG